MNVEVCDPCFHRGKLVVGTNTQMRFATDGDDTQGEVTLCPNCRAALDEALAEFISISRVIQSGSVRFPCGECGHQAVSQEALRKHKERHKAAERRAQALAEVA